VRAAAVPERDGTVAPVVLAVTRARVSDAGVRADRTAGGRGYQATGHVELRRLKRSGAVRIYLWQRVNGTWVGHGHTTARLTDHGSASIYRAVIYPSEPGKWRLRAHHSSRDHAPHWSAHYTYLTVD